MKKVSIKTSAKSKQLVKHIDEYFAKVSQAKKSCTNLVEEKTPWVR